MSYSVLVAVDGAASSSELTALIKEAGDFDVPLVAFTTGDVLPALDRREVDVALLHEDLGPLPMVDLLRQISSEHPEVGTVVAMRQPTTQSVRAVMEAGARAVVTMPFTLEELHTRLLTAATWSESVRRRMRGADDDGRTVRSRLVAVAGAKGGVGTTSITVRMALAAARSEPRRRVCLVDLDLQTGDVPASLGILHRRSIADLIEVAQDITARAVEDSLFVHSSGLRVLLAPAEGELTEDVTGPVAQRILGALRSLFDVVIVDCGAVSTMASALAVEMADDVLMVVTPDIPAVRAAKRLLRLWSRLEVCKPDDVQLVVNRASRDNEVQPGLISKIIGVPVAKTHIPAQFRKLEHDINSAPPDKAEDWTLWNPVVRLGREISLLPTPRRRWLRRPGRRAARTPTTATARGGGDEGSGPVEALIAIFVSIILFLCLIQAGLAGFTVVMASRAANAGARAYGIGADPDHAAKASLLSGWRDDAEVDAHGEKVTVSLSVPMIFGDLSSGYDGFRVSMTAGTVSEDSTW